MVSRSFCWKPGQRFATWFLGLVKSAASTALLLVAARLAACVWGENYWLIGHSGVFLAMVGLLAYATVDMMLPAPNSTKVRRQRAAAEMLEALQEKIAGGSHSGAPAGGAAEDPEEPKATAVTTAEPKKKKLAWYLHPGWALLVVLIIFSAEVALVTVFFEPPHISMCDTCDARAQQYYAGVALGIGFVFAVSLYGVRRSQYQALGKKGPLLETAPLNLVLAYLCWVAVAGFTSWVVDSWAVLVHVSFLPLIAGLFFSAHHRWVLDDFHLLAKRPSPSGGVLARVVPVADAEADPAADPAAGDSAAAGSSAAGADAPAAGTSGEGGSSIEAAAPAPCCLVGLLQRIPWPVRIWVLCIVLDIAYGVVLHLVSELRFRWVGWSIATGVLVLALTFMSNRLWFGTLQLDKAQPILWAIIILILVAWGGLVWYFHHEMQVDFFAMGILCVVFLYPAVYTGVLAVQVLRDAQWNPKDKATWLFVRNAILFSAAVYTSFLVVIAFRYWPVALCGFCLLLMVVILGIAFLHWLRNNRFVSRKAKIISGICLSVCILGAAVGITYYFQSIFGGFTAVCAGAVVLLLGAALLEVSDAQQRTSLEKLRIGSSSLVFPMYRFKGGELARAQWDIVALLEAFFVLALWGLVAAAVLDDWPSLGMVVAVLSVMCALILMAHLISLGGWQRATVLRDLPEAQLLAAAKEALSGGDSAATVEGADEDDGTTTVEVTKKTLEKAIQEFRTKCKNSMDEYHSQVQVACAGRFHTLPPVALWQTLNAGVALIRKGQGCVTIHTPDKPHEEHRKLLAARRAWWEAVRSQQRFGARLQLCLVSAQAQQMWAKESEFRSFLQSQGAEAKGLTMDDFKQLPADEKADLEAAWEVWKGAEAAKLKLEEQRRQEEEEAARRRAEEQRRRKLEAREAVDKLKDAGNPKEIQKAINAGLAAGLAESDDVMAHAIQHVKELEEVEKLLKELLEAQTVEEKAQIEKLREALNKATIIHLESDLIEQANQKITDYQRAIAEAEEAERRRKEAERLKKLEEEAKKRHREKEQELAEAKQLLEQALAQEDEGQAQIDKLQDAIERATVAGLEGDLIQTARQRISDIRSIMKDEEEEERKKKEAERLRQLEEEAERKRKAAEEERKRKEAEELEKRAGEPKVVEANIDLMKSVAERNGEFTDNVWTPEAMGEKPNCSEYKIQRIRELVGKDEVVLFNDGCHPNDIHQGELGDCWFLSAIACLSAREDKVKALFTYSDPAKGLYIVRFYKNGVFQDVTIDDFFPTKYHQCAFASSGKRGEVWVQVLEKAYAKLHGSFDAIEGGFVNDALVDMTGGIGGKIHLQDKEAKKDINDGTMWAKLKGLSRDGHLLGCGSGSGKDTDISDMGIVKGHAYSLLRVEEVDGHRLVQLRNPWGNTEWKGKWSDSDEESWTQKMRKKLGYVNKDDGTFWMAFEDFVLHYRVVYICRIMDKSDGWQRIFVTSEWRGETAGGCSNYSGTYEKNPRINLKVVGRVKLLLTLEQADSRGSLEGDEEVPIAFKVFKDKNIHGSGVTSSGTYCYDREVFVDVELTENSSGPYIILPTTFKPGMERGFIMKAIWKGDAGAVQMWKE